MNRARDVCHEFWEHENDKRDVVAKHWCGLAAKMMNPSEIYLLVYMSIFSHG
jgi:hypothetical protein